MKSATDAKLPVVVIGDPRRACAPWVPFHKYQECEDTLGNATARCPRVSACDGSCNALRPRILELQSLSDAVNRFLRTLGLN